MLSIKRMKHLESCYLIEKKTNPKHKPKLNIKKHFFLDKEKKKQMLSCHIPLLKFNTGRYYACDTSLEKCCRLEKIPNYQYHKHININELNLLLFAFSERKYKNNLLKLLLTTRKPDWMLKIGLDFLWVGFGGLFFFPIF